MMLKGFMSKWSGLTRNRGVAALALAVMSAGLAFPTGIAHAASIADASPGNFPSNSLRGRYVCRVDSDSTYVSSVVILQAKIDGTVSGVKALLSADFESEGVPILCVYSMASVNYSINADGTGEIPIVWTADEGINEGCPAGGNDLWEIALSGATNFARNFFVASQSNNGGSYHFKGEPGSGSCARK